MDANDITTLISSVGFPIVCCLIMFYLVYTLNNSFRSEIKELTETINENILTLQKILDKLEAIENERRKENTK